MKNPADYPPEIKPTQYQDTRPPSPTGNHHGFVAQEVQEALDQLQTKWEGVTVPESTDQKASIGLSAFIVPLVRALQQVNQRSIALKTEIDQLTSEVPAF